MDPLSIALGLSRFVPGLVRWIGGDKAGEVAEKVVDVARSVTGHEDPRQAAAAIERNPELQLKLQQAMAPVLIAQYEAETRRLESVNQTMQAESRSEHWPQYSWRPFWGFASAAAFFIVTAFVCVLGWQAIQGRMPEALPVLPMLISSFATLFAIPGAILGVAAWHRGKQQRLAAGETPQLGLMAALSQRLAQKG